MKDVKEKMVEENKRGEGRGEEEIEMLLMFASLAVTRKILTKIYESHFVLVPGQLMLRLVTILT